jgi:hypothetical protein
METSKEEKPVTWRMVTETVKLSKLQLRNIVKLANQQLPNPDDEIQPELLMCVLTADMLMRLSFLSAEQRELILSESAYARNAGISEFAQIVFADGQYCTWTENTGFLNLETGETVTQIPVPPMETISYNLTELYRRGRHQITKRYHHGKRPDAQSDVEEPADVRERSADGVSG